MVQTGMHCYHETLKFYSESYFNVIQSKENIQCIPEPVLTI